MPRRSGRECAAGACGGRGRRLLATSCSARRFWYRRPLTAPRLPPRRWFETHYHVKVGEKGAETPIASVVVAADVKQSHSLKTKIAGLQKDVKIDPKVVEQFQTGKVLAAISSRPGQSGRVDGYVLEGAELEFYQRKLALKKTGKATAAK